MSDTTHDGFGWNDRVDVPESGFELLPEGPAVFQITKLERQRKEFGKFGTCNVAVITFLCSPLDGEGSSEVQSQFALVKALGWKIVKLATACGFRKSGDGNEIDPRWWGHFDGATGRCEIGHRTYTGKKDGKERTANEITDFLVPENAGSGKGQGVSEGESEGGGQRSDAGAGAGLMGFRSENRRTECGSYIEHEEKVMELRGYQNAARLAVTREWERVQRTLLVLPTGTGKTIVFSALARDVVARGGRVLILAHREELIRQAADKLRRATGLACAIEKADEYAEGCLERVVVGSVQTLLSPERRRALPEPTHIIVDEAHHALSDSYQAVLREWPGARVLGVTATPDRGDMRELGSVFESLAFEYPLPQAIADGFLCPIRALTLPVAIDLRNQKPAGGDWSREQVASALEPYLPELTRLYAEHARDRKGLVFVPLCATGRKVVEAFRAHGLRAYFCDGQDRSEIAGWEADGPGSVMVNAMLLTEGYDHPPIDAIAVWRFTRSRPFYCQMVGRGTRIHPGKERLLLIDNLFLTGRHSLCRPANLVADNEEVAEKLIEAAERDAARGTNLDEEALTRAKEEVIAEREAALAKKLAEMRHRKRELVDPVQYAVSVGAPSLVDYRPALPAEAAPPTAAQVEALSKAGIFAGGVQHAGHADAILATLADRKAGGFASPKQVRRLELYGWTRAGQMTYAAAQKVISRIAANGWRVPHGLQPDQGLNGESGKREA